MALGVVGSVGHFSHFHRTGRISVPLAELAAFVARYVVHSVAADEQAITDALRGARRWPSASRWARGSASA